MEIIAKDHLEDLSHEFDIEIKGLDDGSKYNLYVFNQDKESSEKEIYEIINGVSNRKYKIYLNTFDLKHMFQTNKNNNICFFILNDMNKLISKKEVIVTGNYEFRLKLVNNDGRPSLKQTYIFNDIKPVIDSVASKKLEIDNAYILTHITDRAKSYTDARGKIIETKFSNPLIIDGDVDYHSLSLVPDSEHKYIDDNDQFSLIFQGFIKLKDGTNILSHPLYIQDISI